MDKVSCDICLDLLPLVKDGVASEDSKKIVLEHLSTCKNCKDLYENNNIENEEAIMLDDEKVLSSIKRKLHLVTLLMLLIGSFIGVSLSNSMNMFYNILIMPFLGGVSYLVFNWEAYKISVGIFIISYIWQIITFILEDSSIDIFIFFGPLYLSFAYYILFIIGIIICLLLSYGFSKEE